MKTQRLHSGIHHSVGGGSKGHLGAQPFILFLVLCCSFIFAWSEILAQAYQLAVSSLELARIEAAHSFFQKGIYARKSDLALFPVGLLPGIFATWPAGLVRSLNGMGVLHVRVALAIVIWAHFLILATSFFYRFVRVSSPLLALVSASLSFNIFLLLVPSWSLSLQNNGAVLGALWLASGMYLIFERPYWSALFFGFAVWGCRFEYLGILAVFFFVVMFFQEPSWKTLRTLLIQFVVFFLPAIFWWGWILGHTNWDYAVRWASQSAQQLVALDLQNGMISTQWWSRIRTALNRLTSDGPEQVRVVFFTVGSFLLSLALSFRLILKGNWRVVWVAGIFFLCSSFLFRVVVLGTSIEMDSALALILVSFGWVLFETVHFLYSFPKNRVRPIVVVLLLAILVARQAYWIGKGAYQPSSSVSYCRVLTSTGCTAGT